MSLAALDLSSASGAAEVSAGLPVPRLPGLVLVRLAAAREGLGESDLARELHPVVAEALDAREWQRKLSEVIASLTQRLLQSPATVTRRPLVRRVAGRFKRMVRAALAGHRRSAAGRG